MDELNLAAEFPSATREQWLERASGVLKGADFEAKLVGRTYDGLRVEPLFPKAVPPAQPGRAAHGRWRIGQRVDHPDPTTANALALADLAGGADQLAFIYAGAPSGRGFGVEARSLDELDRALEGVMLDLIDIRLETPPFAGTFAATQWVALLRRRGLDPAVLRIDFGLDPIGDMARSGRLPARWAGLEDAVADASRQLRESGLNGPMLRVDTRLYQEAGASEAQELAAALATGVAYLRALETAGHTLETARRAVTFLLVADADELLTIAKLRALRRLWARVEAACELEPKPVRLEVETAWRMTTRRDPWVNMLRTTNAAFSAGIGGADSITVLPFTAALGLADAFARRIARNTQLILLEEANLWRVEDPAAGAGTLEALTQALCELAWERFQEIEREGGMTQSLLAGRFQSRVANVRSDRENAIATRRDPITGTSEFPNLRESAVAVLLRSGQEREVSCPEPAADPGPSEGIRFPALPSTRAAEPFERLRDQSDAILAQTGRRPRVFLANLGPVSAFTGRATFAKNFFEAGGLECITNDGFPSSAALTEAFQSSGAEATCLCSTDTIYASDAEQAARALSGAGCARILLAGPPGKLESQFRSAGVEMFIFSGCNVIDVLTRLVQP